jgi:hypothetical protein
MDITVQLSLLEVDLCLYIQFTRTNTEVRMKKYDFHGKPEPRLNTRSVGEIIDSEVRKVQRR